MNIKELKKLLDIIQLDNQSGSADILKQLVIAMKLYLSKSPTLKPHEVGELMGSLNSFIAKHDNFMIVKHFIKYWINEANQHLGDKDFNHQMLTFMESYSLNWKHTGKKIAVHFEKKLNTGGKSILTLSNSSTLLEVFSALTNQSIPLKIVQLESRPLNEGRLQAEKLVNLNCKVTLVTDAAAAIKTKDIDMIVVGADSIYSTSFINKTGTFQLALLASYFKKPFYVLTDSRKIAREKEQYHNKQALYPAGEIWKHPPPGHYNRKLLFRNCAKSLRYRIYYREENYFTRGST